MDFQAIVNLALSLVGKRNEIVAVVQDAVALWKKIQGIAPDLVKQAEATAGPKYNITWLQESLNKLGAKLDVDGKYGSATREAVKGFQEAHGLAADGWAGVQTQAAIVDALK